MRSYRASKSTSTATTTSASVSGDSQPESAIERHQQGSFAGLLTTVHTPESTYIPAAERYAGLRLLAEVSTLRSILLLHLLPTKLSLSMMKLKNNPPVLYHCLLSHYYLMSHHRRPMMLTPSWWLQNLMKQGYQKIPNVQVAKI